MEQGSPQKIFTIDVCIHHTEQFRQCCRVGSSVEHCKLGFFEMLRLQGIHVVIRNSSECIWILGCACSSRRFLTAVPKQSLFHMMQVYPEIVCQRFIVGNVCRNFCPVCQPGAFLEHQGREQISHSHFQSNEFVLDSVYYVPPNMPSSSHSTQFYIFDDRAAEIQMIIT